MEEASDYIVLALDERLALRKIYNKGIGAEFLTSNWIRGYNLAPRKPSHHPCCLWIWC